MLRDTIRFLDLSVWPELALVIFVGVFLLVSARTLRSKSGFNRAMAAAALDLDDIDQIQSTKAREPHDGE
ncbi:MAG: hypothetical protein AAGB51_06770 [Planctomycetota bacterium]